MVWIVKSCLRRMGVYGYQCPETQSRLGVAVGVLEKQEEVMLVSLKKKKKKMW